MQFKIHPRDLEDLVKLTEEKEKVCCNVNSGSLKLGDVEIVWSTRKPLITFRGKDIEH